MLSKEKSDEGKSREFGVNLQGPAEKPDDF
jgi:hypothetical protein